MNDTYEQDESYDFDIIIPVFNALEFVQKCISSVKDHDNRYKQQIIIINDGSDENTTQWLQEVSTKHPNIKLIENEQNIGYTKTVNIGLQASKAGYVILLNSDTIVSQYWLEGLRKCAESDPNIGIVGPLSNAASWQSVPKLQGEDGRFCINALPNGFDVESYAAFIKKLSQRFYPEVPFVNGFCFFMKQELVKQIGFFDEKNFPKGYGEENDYCVRALDNGFKCAIADDTYVYHAKSKSFGHEQRLALSSEGDKNFREKHGNKKINDLVDSVKNVTALNIIRQTLSSQLETQQINQFSVLFVLPVPGGGGGVHSIVQETLGLRELGVKTKVAVRTQDLDLFYDLYLDIPNYKDLFIGFTDSTLEIIANRYDVVIGTIFHSMSIVKNISDKNPHIIPAYYIQDYEPLFFDEKSDRYQEALDSYSKVKNAVLFAKTHWIAEQVKKYHGIDVHKIKPSIDHRVYRPIAFRRNTKIAISAMIRPQTPRRGAQRTMLLLQEISEKIPNVEIHTFGCDDNDPLFNELEKTFEFIHHGILKRNGVASVLQSSDLFIDLSDYQAFGRTGLEAMACACASVVPKSGGADEYAIDNKNSLIVDTSKVNEYTPRIIELLQNTEALTQMKLQALQTAAKFSIHSAAVSELTLFSQELIKRNIRTSKVINPVVYVLPTYTDGEVVTGSGFVRLIYPLANNKITSKWIISLARKSKLPKVSEAQIAIIQRNAMGYDLEGLRKWAIAWKKAGNKIIFEIDDDLLDKKGLLLRTGFGSVDALISVIKWLAKAADTIIVSTPDLSKLFSQFNKNIVCIDNKLDKNLWRIGIPRITGDDVFENNDNIIRIGYIGTPTHTQDLEIVTDAVKLIQKKYGKKVQFEVIGAFQNMKKPLFGKRIGLPRQSDYPNFVKWLQKRVNWDITIIPLVNDNFNNSKSHLKFLECTALHLPCICSDVPSYNKIVSNNLNGLLCKNTTTDWFNALETLINNKDLRTSLANEAYKLLSEEYTTDQNASAYCSVFEDTISRLPTKIPTIEKTYFTFEKTRSTAKRNHGELSLFQKRLIKLISNPYQYCHDSKWLILRKLSPFLKAK